MESVLLSKDSCADLSVRQAGLVGSSGLVPYFFGAAGRDEP